MKSKYDLNLQLFEVCTVLMNCSRWKGILELESELKKHQGKLVQEVYEFIEYGIQIISEGNIPEIRDFLLNEEIQRSVFNEKTKKDLRLVVLFMKWIQEGKFGSQFSLIQAMNEDGLNSKLQNWSHMNEYDLSITMEQAVDMSNDDCLELRAKNPVVRDFYDRQLEEMRKDTGF